jgi:hypothetical protein
MWLVFAAAFVTELVHSNAIIPTKATLNTFRPASPSVPKLHGGLAMQGLSLAEDVITQNLSIAETRRSDEIGAIGLKPLYLHELSHILSGELSQGYNRFV